MARLESNYYSFFREELPDFSYVYQFSTSYNLGYKVYFNVSEYDKWLAEYPYASDNRQEFRGRLFHGWYNYFSPSSFLIKNDLEVFIPGSNGRDHVTYYLGYIAHPSNASLDMLHAEFEDISMRFVGVSNIK